VRRRIADAAEPQPRKLVVCCDGTWNRRDAPRAATNVAKMARSLGRWDDSGEPDLVENLLVATSAGSAPRPSLRVHRVVSPPPPAYEDCQSQPICNMQPDAANSGGDVEVVFLAFLPN
jgi:hypothetical protein